MSYSKYKAYCQEFQVPFKLNRGSGKTITVIGGTEKELGTAVIPIPFQTLNAVIDVKFQIMDNYIPSLLSMKDMYENGLDLSIQRKVIMYGDLEQDLIFENFFLVHRWEPSDMEFSLYSEEELRKLHKVFGHPSVSSLHNLLKRANPEDFDHATRTEIEKITDQCKICTGYERKPRRFKITVGTEDLKFNHIVAVDVMYIHGKAVIHIVDEATHICAAKFLKNQSSSEVWNAITTLWSNVYLGPPDVLHVDQGTNFVSQEFKSYAETDSIKLMEAPIKSPSTMTHVERYHAPFRAAYAKIREDLDRKVSNNECLQLTVKSVNDTVGPEGLCPTLLVFGTIPRPARKQPAASQLERAKAKDMATKEFEREIAKRKIEFTKTHAYSPKGKESSAELHSLPAGAPILVLRENSKSWEGPFPFINIEGETVVVQLPHGRKIFRFIVVKPTNESILASENSAFYGTYEFWEQDKMAFFGTTNARIAHKSEIHKLKNARKAELDGLIKNKTFKVVKRSTVPTGTRIYGAGFVDSFKTVDNEIMLKSRMIAQNYMDEQSSQIATRSPTIQRSSQRIICCTAASHPDHKAYNRDMPQEYTQSLSNLERDVYLNAPTEMGLQDDECLLVLKPLYRIPESGLHWFITFQNHHKQGLGIFATRVDPCLLRKRNGRTVHGVTAIQVDDTFGHCSDPFLESEDSKTMNLFKTKQQKLMTPGYSVTFNGTVIRFEKDRTYSLSQKEKLKVLEPATTNEDFKSLRAKIQYVGVMSGPDLCSAVQLLSSGNNNPSTEDIKHLNKIIKYSRRTAELEMKFDNLDLESGKLYLFTDASFANANNLKSKIGFVIVLVDKHNKANIIHYGSSRCKRITRSVTAAEIYGLLFGFDNAVCIQHLLEELIGISFEIHGLADSETLFNVITKDGRTLEKRLQIDVWAVRESFSNGELKTLSWIPSVANIADALTKGLITEDHALIRLMRLNLLDINKIGWVKKIDKNNFEKRKSPSVQ